MRACVIDTIVDGDNSAILGAIIDGRRMLYLAFYVNISNVHEIDRALDPQVRFFNQQWYCVFLAVCQQPGYSITVDLLCSGFCSCGPRR
jgi:hypothetical protein